MKKQRRPCFVVRPLGYAWSVSFFDKTSTFSDRDKALRSAIKHAIELHQGGREADVIYINDGGHEVVWSFEAGAHLVGPYEQIGQIDDRMRWSLGRTGQGSATAMSKGTGSTTNLVRRPASSLFHQQSRSRS